MRLRVGTILLTAFLCLAPTASWAGLAPYNQDFEGLAPTDGDPGVWTPSDPALENDGWLIYGNVFCPNYVCYVGGYGPYGAPNGGYGGWAFSAVVTDQGGSEQGAQQLVAFNDYNNFHHSWALVEANVYQQQTISAEDVGSTWVFEFDAKRGDIGGATTAAAFIKAFDPYWNLTYIPLDMTAVPDTWGSYSISITIGPNLVGGVLQFGFLSTATGYEPSGVFYDNVGFRLAERSVGFWTHQCRDLGFTQVSQPELNALFADVTASSACVPADCSVLDFTPPLNDMRTKAERQALALWLNVASGRLFDTTPADLPGLTSATRVGAAMAEIETTLCDPEATFSDLEMAKDIAEALNLGGEDMELASEASSLKVKPGDTVTITLGLVNMSPEIENYSLMASSAWPVTLSHQMVTGLGAGQVAVVTADVSVPNSLPKGRTGQVTVTAIDLFSDVGLRSQAVIDFEVKGSSAVGGNTGPNRPVQHQFLPDAE